MARGLGAGQPPAVRGDAHQFALNRRDTQGLSQGRFEAGGPPLHAPRDSAGRVDHALYGTRPYEGDLDDDVVASEA